MSTKIEWCNETWNPTTGCTKVSPGCANCYIERQTPMRVAGRRFVKGKIPIEIHENRLSLPLSWRTPRRVFVDSMSDLFHEDVPADLLLNVWVTMAMCQEHQFLILTKRPARMREFVNEIARVYSADFWPLPNVWLGVTAENQRMADERIPILLETPAAVHFLSCEPLLAPVDLERWLSRYWNCDRPMRAMIARGMLNSEQAASVARRALDWVIVGGESGPRRRPMDLAWARAVRDQCRAAGVAFFMKQLGGPRAGTSLEELPPDLQVREYPR